MSCSWVWPLHVAPGTPAVGHVLACTLVKGGTMMTQSTCFCPGTNVKLEHICTELPEGSGPGGGGAGGSAGGGGATVLKLYATVPVQYTGPLGCMG
jgi:hypothetical protein